MPYIGTQPLTGQFKKLDAITVVNGQAAYTMQYNSSNYKPATANALLVSVNGVIQAAGDAYTINGSTITFTENLVTGDVIDFIIALGDTGSAVTPVDGSVTTDKLANDAVTSDKLAHDIAVQTSLSVPTIKDSSGTNTAMSIDSSGRILTPARPAFKAYKSGGAWQSFGSTNRTIFPFDSTSINVGNCYDTSNYKFVAPVAGIYHFDFQWYTDDSGVSEGFLFRNSETNPRLYIRATEQGTTLTGSCLLDLDVNDEIKVYGEVQSSNADDWFAREDYCFFQGYLVG